MEPSGKKINEKKSISLKRPKANTIEDFLSSGTCCRKKRLVDNTETVLVNNDPHELYENNYDNDDACAKNEFNGLDDRSSNSNNNNRKAKQTKISSSFINNRDESEGSTSKSWVCKAC
eukprot:Awhi_evm1s13973